MRWLPDKFGYYKYHWQVMQDMVVNNSVESMAEIGVLFGDFAAQMVHLVERYIMVDPWARYPDEWREADSLSHFDDEWWDNCYAAAMKKTEPWLHIREVYRMRSLDGAKAIEDESLDLVFVDELHHYEPMVEDIKTWLPKVKPDGILAGHDWWDDGTGYGNTMEGVKRALLDTFPKEIIHVAYRCCWWDHVWIVFKEDV